MKKLYTYLIILFTSFGAIGQNTFPATGNVGIGTSTPSFKLDIYGTGLIRSRIASGDNQANLLLQGQFGQLENSAGDFFITNSAASNSMIFRTGAAVERMRILSNGNVGIGIANPTQRLEIGGGRPITFNSSLGAIKMKGDAGGWAMNYGFIGSNGTDHGGLWGYGGADALDQWSIGKLYTDNLFVVKTNGNIGLGISNPSLKLHVRNAGNTYIGVDRADNTAQTGVAYMTSGSINWYNFLQTGTNKLQWYNATAGDLLTLIPEGRVGIGTTSPDQKLTVKGGIGFDFNSVDKKLYSPEDGTLEWMTHDLAGSKGFAVSHQGTKKVYLATSGNSYINGGNLGIGTIAPQNKLEISGAANSSGLRFTNLKSTSTVSPSNNKALSVDANGDVILVNASTGSLSSIDSTVRKNIYFQSEGGSILTSQKLSILNNGMVGVGTSTPLTNFHVANGNIGIDLNQRLNLRASDPEGSYLTYTTNFTERTRLIAAYGLYLGSSGLDGITLKVGGNVGIGNTSPNAKLSIGKIAGDFGPNSKYLNSVYANSEVFKMYMDANWNTVLEAVQNTSNQSGLIFNTNNLERLRITNLGNIGIGTNNPRVKLQVTGDTRISGNLNIGDSLSNWIPFNVNQKTAYMYSARFAHSGSSENRQLSVAYKDGSIGLISSVFSTGNVSNLFLNSEGGNVGIGTSNPTTNLHVKANGNSTLKLEGSNVSMIHLASNFGNALINNYNDGSLRINNIYDASSTHMVINSTGNVGIGTSLIPAGFKMAVKGSFIAEKVKVKNSNAWPDFVFKKDYILPSLSDIEKYVNQNSHLPEIPSAAEVEKDGQDLGEMNRLLLKKVEELTLYLIQQEKKNKEQDILIQKLLKQ